MLALKFDGSGDVLKAPACSFNRVELKWYLESSQSSIAYLFARSTDQINLNTSGNLNFTGNIANVVVNGTTLVEGNPLPKAIKSEVVINISSTTSSDSYYFAQSSSGTFGTKGFLYSIKVYNGTTLMFHYDLTSGNANDLSGNGRHGTVTGAVFADDGLSKEYELSLSDSLSLQDNLQGKKTNRTRNDSLVSTDTFGRKISLNKNDSTNLNDSSPPKKASIRKNDSLIPTDSLTWLKGKHFKFIESLAVSDSITSKIVKKSQQDNISYTDSIGKRVSKTKSDTANLSDGRQVKRSKLFSDAVSTLGEDITKQSITRRFSEQIGATDSVKVRNKTLPGVDSLRKGNLLYIKDLSGNEEVLTGWKGLKRYRSVSGEKTLAFLIFPMDQNLHSFPLVQEESVVEFKGETYRIKQVNEKNRGQSYYKEVVAIHTFFDLSDQYIYEMVSGSKTLQAYLQFVFAGTSYTWSIVDTFSAQDWENLGNNNRIALFLDGLKRYGAEFTLNGTHLTFKKKIGNATDYQLRYNYNIKTITRTVNTHNLFTHIKGFGKKNEDETYAVQTEYTSPNSSVFGVRHAKPVYDERYTTVSGLLERLKAELQDTPEISITLDFIDMRRAGFPYDVPNEGDDIFLIYEPMKLDMETRIVDITEEFAEFSEYPIKTEVTIANHRNKTADKFLDYDRAQKDVKDIIEGNKPLPYSSLDAAVRRATEALQSAQTEVEFNNGFILRSKDNPNFLVAINSNGIGISRNGGQTFLEALTSAGFVASAGVVGSFAANNITIGNGTKFESGYDPSKLGTYIDETGVYTGKVKANQIEAGTLTSSGSLKVDIRNGNVESFVNDKLAMKFGQYSLDFYYTNGELMGSIGPTYILNNESERGLGVFVENDYFTIGHNISGSNKASFRTSVLDKETWIDGAYSSDRSKVYLRSNSYLSYTNARSSDQATILLEDNGSSNNLYMYFGGVRNRTSSYFELLHNDASGTVSSVIKTTKDSIALFYDDLVVTRDQFVRIPNVRFGHTSNPHSISVIPFSTAVRWQLNDSNYIIQFDNGQVEFYMGGASRHAFFTNGTKTGGSIEIDGENLGMSPVDSPQVLIEYIEFNIPLDPAGVKVYLDPSYAKAVEHFAVFTNNGQVIEKGIDYFIIAGEGMADCRIIGERIEYKDVFWGVMGQLKEVAEVVEDTPSNVRDI